MYFFCKACGQKIDQALSWGNENFMWQICGCWMSYDSLLVKQIHGYRMSYDSWCVWYLLLKYIFIYINPVSGHMWQLRAQDFTCKSCNHQGLREFIDREGQQITFLSKICALQPMPLETADTNSSLTSDLLLEGAQADALFHCRGSMKYHIIREYFSASHVAVSYYVRDRLVLRQTTK